MLFRRIEINDHDWKEDLEGFKYVGVTLGCGCCEKYKGLTVLNLKQHIMSLEGQLRQAKEILAEIQSKGTEA